MTFDIGDRVRIKAETVSPASIVHLDKVGIVNSVNDADTLPYPYEVKFPNGSLCFADFELETVSETEPQALAPAEPAMAEEGRLGGGNIYQAFVEKVRECLTDQPECDEVTKPSHYTGFSNGSEVRDIAEHLPFNLGNVVKYVARAGRKTDDPTTDLLKALDYLLQELARLGNTR